MFFEIQFPYSDFRPILKKKTYNIDINNIISVRFQQNKKDTFFRSFGKIAHRPKGCSKYLKNENLLCYAKKAIKLEDFTHHIHNLNTGITIKRPGNYRPYRALFTHSTGIVNRFQFGFQFDPLNSNKKIFKNRNIFDLLIKGILDLNVKLPSQDSSQQVRLIDIQEGIGNLLLLSKIKDPQKYIDKVENWWIESGEPVVILEIDNKKNNHLFLKHCKHIASIKNYGLELYHYRILLNNLKYDVWVIYKNDSCDKHPIEVDQEIRELRIHFLRLHAEIEVLQRVLFKFESIKLNKRYIEMELLKKYFDSEVFKVFSTNNFNDLELLKKIWKYLKDINIDKMESLSEKLESLMKRITNIEKSNFKNFLKYFLNITE